MGFPEYSSTTPLVSVDQVVAYLGFPQAPTANQATQLATFIQAATGLIQRACDFIVPTQGVEEHDGWSGDTLMLYHAPVVSVESVVENWGSTGSQTLTEVTIGGSNPAGYQLQAETGRLIRIFAGTWPMPWYPGSRNVQVTYTAGRPSVPGEITLAAFMLVAFWWSESQVAAPYIAQQMGSQGAPARGAGFGIPNRVKDLIHDHLKENLA
ncbi:MAG: hypothetical protein ACYDHP_00620 [Ferrimicrobium sp.]